jgi:hypothetical protein
MGLELTPSPGGNNGEKSSIEIMGVQQARPENRKEIDYGPDNDNDSDNERSSAPPL